MPFITKFVASYLAQNPNGSFDKPIGFTSNGDGFKKFCHFVNYVFWEKCWIEGLHIEQKLKNFSVNDIINNPRIRTVVDMSIFIPILKTSATYTAHKYLRRAWSILWSSTITPAAKGVIPPELKKMKYYWRKGFNILLHFVPEMACLIYYCLCSFNTWNNFGDVVFGTDRIIYTNYI